MKTILFRTCLFAALCFSTLTLEAQHFHISEYSGSDSNPGTLAAPWRTLDRLRLALPGGLQDGDTLSLECGGIYTGQIDIDNSSQNVVIKAYGSGAKPVVSGSIPVTTWTNAGAGVWRAKVDTTVTPAYLFQGGSLRTPARYPNTGWIRNVFCVDDPLPATSRFRLVPPTSPPSLIGAQLVARTYNWQFQTSTVISVVAPDTIRCSPRIRSMENFNWGYFFQGTKALLDTVGEWCFVDGVDSVYYHTGGMSAPTDVRLSVFEYGVNIRGGVPRTENVRIQGIVFQEHVQAGVGLRGNGAGSHQVEVIDCGFERSFKGIRDANSIHAPGRNIFSNNHFTDLYDVALESYGDSSSVINNVLEDIGLVPGNARSGFGGSMGMYVGGNGYTVQENVLKEIGYAGISAIGRGGISRNRVHRSLVLLNDGGGIQFDRTDSLVVEENIITDLGDPANLESSASVNAAGTIGYSAYHPITYGIYFGNISIQNATIRRNIVSGCDIGIHVDHSKCSDNAQVLENTLFNNRAQLSMSDYSNYTDDRSVDPSTTCFGDNINQPAHQGTGGTNYVPAYADTYSDNIAYCLNSAQRCVEQAHIWPNSLDSLVDFGAFNDNHWFNSFSDSPFLVTAKFGSDHLYPLSIPQWRTTNSEPTAVGSSRSLLDHNVASVT